jgi:hypothetical protein
LAAGAAAALSWGVAAAADDDDAALTAGGAPGDINRSFTLYTQFVCEWLDKNNKSTTNMHCQWLPVEPIGCFLFVFRLAHVLGRRHSARLVQLRFNTNNLVV